MNGLAAEFEKNNRLATDVVLLVMSAVSGFFTYQGAVMVLDQEIAYTGPNIKAAIFAIGVTAMLYLFWRYVFGIVPRMRTRETRWKGLAIVALSSLFIVSLSSWMNVTALAGRGAMEAHMRADITARQDALHRAYERAKAVEQLAPDLQAMAAHYADLAQGEITDGRLTGVRGAGGVSASLLSTKNAIDDLIASLRKEMKAAEASHADGQALLSAMDRLASNDGPIADRLSAYGEKSARVAAITGALTNSGLSRAIARTIRGLSSSTGIHSLSLSNASLAKAQHNALQRVARDLEEKGERIAKAADELAQAESIETKPFERIAVSTAVVLYADTLIPYWAGGLALDLMPVVLILLLMLLFFAAEEPEPVDRDVDAMSFKEVRKVFEALDRMRQTSVTALQEEEQRKRQTLPPKTRPHEAPADDQRSDDQLSDEELDEWEKHIKGGKLVN